MAKPGEAFPTLPTQRLCLRRIEPRDVGGLHECLGDPEAMRFWDFPACQTMAETEKVMAWLAKTTSPYDHLGWAIAGKAEDQCIGMVSYHHREARNKRLEVGYIVARRHQGQGFGTEAVRAVLDYCVGTLGVHRVQALIHPDNQPSIRLVERLGFRREGGPLTDYWRVGDQYRSAMLYAFIVPADGAAPGEPARAGTKARRPGRGRKTGRPGA
jgi:[ribosomal protein S5]-alanine N-acetyltransferase